MRIEEILDPETENFIFERTMAVVTTFYNIFSCGEAVLRFSKSSSANLGEPRRTLGKSSVSTPKMDLGTPEIVAVRYF